MNNRKWWFALTFFATIVSASTIPQTALSQQEGINVVFENYVDGADAGGYMVVDGVTYPAPKTFYDQDAFTEFEAWPGQERFTNRAKPDKHINWFGSAGNFLLHQPQIVIPPLDPGAYSHQRANFRTAETGITRVKFVDGSTTGQLLFHDPWYLSAGDHTQYNQFETYSSPYYPNGSYAESSNAEGLFWNMAINAGPHYSMRVPWILDQTTKQMQHEPPTTALDIGDWVCYGMFGSYASGANIAYEPSRQQTDMLTRAIEFKGYTAVTAEYTGHRCSKNQTPATKINSQRKVALAHSGRVGSGNYIHHGVYESEGKIFYIRSTDNGATWSPEELVSDYWSWASQPSIAASYSGYDAIGGTPLVFAQNNVTYIVYIEDQDVVVKYRMNQASGAEATWIELDRIQRDLSFNDAVTPVVAAKMPNSPEPDNGCVIVWEVSNALHYSVYDGFAPYVYNSVTYRDQTLASGHVNFKGVQAQPLKPSICADAFQTISNPHQAYHVAWYEGGYLYMNDINVIQAVGVSTPFPLTSRRGDVIKKNSAPSLSNHYQIYDLVAFETETPPMAYPVPSNLTTIPLVLGGNQYYPIAAPLNIVKWTPPLLRKSVVVRKLGRNYGGHKIDMSWMLLPINGTALEFLNPSVGSNFDTYDWNQNVRVLVNRGTSFSITELDGRTNRQIIGTQYNDGFDPNVCTLGELVAVYSESQSTPFNYRVQSEHSSLNKTATTYLPPMKQMVVQNEDSSIAQYGICMPQIVDSEGTATEIQWRAASDSAMFETPYTVEELMTTESFSVPVAGYIEYATDIYAENIVEFGGDFSFNVRFFSADSGALLLEDQIPISALPTDSAMYMLYRIDLSEISGRDVYMTLGLADTTEGLTKYVRNLCVMDPPEMEKASSPGVFQEASVELYQSFPNPFNPSTDITYGIPEETHVKLAVYDNLGREVKVLANGWKAAGTYTVTFDAAELPSGMYLYRIETGKGSVSKKMVLMK